MFAASNYPITIAEVGSFSRDARGSLGEDELKRLVDYLAYHPEVGDVIPGTGGVRKVRWGYKDRGKRGGLRIIYYFRDLNMPLYLLAMYRKGEKADLTQAEKKMMCFLVDELVRAHSRVWLRIVNEQLA